MELGWCQGLRSFFWDVIIIAIIRKVNYDGLTLFCGYNVKCHVYSNFDCYFLVQILFLWKSTYKVIFVFLSKS